MRFVVKSFDELSNCEVYEILKARMSVFMLEQGIQVLDMDDVDYESYHCFIEEEGRVIAYLRAFYHEGNKNTIRLGRVLTITHGLGHGVRLMEESIRALRKKMMAHHFVLDAQKYAIDFYKKFGFDVYSDEYVEAGVIHVMMEADFL